MGSCRAGARDAGSDPRGRARRAGADGAAPGSPAAVLEIAERVVADGGERGGDAHASLGADEARPCSAPGSTRSTCPRTAGADRADAGGRLQPLRNGPAGDAHPRAPGLREAVDPASRRPLESGKGYDRAAGSAAVRACDAGGKCRTSRPTTILGSEMAKLASREGGAETGGAGGRRGRIDARRHPIRSSGIREHGVPGWEVEVIGTDSRVDRRLPAVAEVEVPFYAGMSIGVLCVRELVQTLVEGRYDLRRLASPGPAGIGAALTARIDGTSRWWAATTPSSPPMPACAAAIRQLESGVCRAALALFYGQCEMVLSPSPPADGTLTGLLRSLPSGSRAGLAASTSSSTTRDGERSRGIPRRGQGPLRRPADQGEGRRPAR